ncbi:anti-sigma factor family protein [Streptomyces sp. NPDC058548]|uniref:anti-sigma factor family protein n=1 Tax=unclassified Streptomyces TaxID=2593676 RepID=UPI00366691CB
MTVPQGEGCQERLLLGAYVLGILPPEEDRSVAEHLQECAECGAEYLEMTEAQQLLSLITEADLLDGMEGSAELERLGRAPETRGTTESD